MPPPKKTGPAAKRKTSRSGIIKKRAPQEEYILRLYVNDSSLKSLRAIENMKLVCEQYLNGRYQLEVIDIGKHTHLARNEQIVAVPTLIKQLPPPLRKLVGDMSDLSKVLFGLDLKVRE